MHAHPVDGGAGSPVVQRVMQADWRQQRIGRQQSCSPDQKQEDAVAQSAAFRAAVPNLGTSGSGFVEHGIIETILIDELKFWPMIAPNAGMLIK
jgi:hypothetical protein